MSVFIVYVTMPDQSTAEQIGRTLVEERLVACANILPGMTSVYRWEGRVESASELLLLAKTQTERFDDVISRVRELHPYECPCIVGWPVEQGHQTFLDWVHAETRTP